MLSIINYVGKTKLKKHDPNMIYMKWTQVSSFSFREGLREMDKVIFLYI